MSDHIVFITGATAGFGAATARRFVKEGARVVITGRRADRLDELKAELGDAAHAIVLDVRDQDAVFAVFDNLPEGFRDVTILVNNAGLAMGLEGAHEAKMSDWNTMIDTNIKGFVAVARAALTGMVERDHGHIVNLGSVAGTYPYPGGNVYGGTKAFVHQFSLNMRADLVGKNIRVTSIEPGMAETEFSVVRFGGDADKASGVYKGMQPMTPDNVAEAIYWVTSMPAHVNVNVVEMMAAMQAFSPFNVHRD